jgi:hypothetical protein
MADILNILAGTAIFIVLLMLATPAFIASGYLLNKPGGQTKSGVHFFTLIEPGEVKFVARGDSIVRAIMNTSRKSFAKIGTPRDESYWTILDRRNLTDEPIQYVWWPLRWWASYVYSLTGAVFIGIYPFQKVREYTLERTKVNRTEQLGADGTVGENLTLTVERDVSDHYRLRRFIRYEHVIGAETKDKIPVDFLFAMECETTNPFMAAFGIDEWDQALSNYAADKLTQFTRTMTLDQILTAENADVAAKLQQAIKEGTEPEEEIGVTIKSVRFLKQEPRVSPEELQKLRAEAMARQQAKATRIDGEARADVLREMNKATEEGGASALANLDAETRARVAAAAGAKGIVIMGQGVDPIQAAQLRALEDKLKEDGK